VINERGSSPKGERKKEKKKKPKKKQKKPTKKTQTKQKQHTQKKKTQNPNNPTKKKKNKQPHQFPCDRFPCAFNSRPTPTQRGTKKKGGFYRSLLSLNHSRQRVVAAQFGARKTFFRDDLNAIRTRNNEKVIAYLLSDVARHSASENHALLSQNTAKEKENREESEKGHSVSQKRHSQRAKVEGKSVDQRLLVVIRLRKQNPSTGRRRRG